MVSNLKPPDGGWGWVILICGFINHMFTVGLWLSLSVFYVSWLDQFGESKSDTSWILSIGAACLSGLCPIPAALAVRFGFRSVAFIGAVLTTFGLILSVFATSITYLVVCIGMITGVGSCFSYLPAVAIVAMYFDKRRSLAMGLNTAGAGIGAFVLAPLINILEEIYGWRGAILLLGGMTLHMCVTSMLMRDLETESEDNLSQDAFESNKDKQQKVAGEGLLKDKTKADLAINPVIKDTCDNDNAIGSLQDLEIESVSELEDLVANKMNDEEEHLDESIRNALVHQPHIASYNLHASYGDLKKNLTLVNENHHSSSFPTLDAWAFDKKRALLSFTKSIQNIDLAVLASMPSLLNKREQLGVTLPRDSNISISQNTSDVKENLEKQKDKRTFISMIFSSKVIKANLDLLSDKAHVIYCVSNFLTNLSYITPVLFMVDRAVYQGISKSDGAILVSANGVGNVAGRIISGYMANHFYTRHICMYISVLVACGVGTMLSDLCGNSVALHVAYAFFSGFFIGSYVVMSPIASVDLVGASVFATAYGQALFCMGIAAIFGPPLAGWLFDWTQSYMLSYLAMGFFLVLSGVILLPLLCRNNKIPSSPTRDDSDVLYERDHESSPGISTSS